MAAVTQKDGGHFRNSDDRTQKSCSSVELEVEDGTTRRPVRIYSTACRSPTLLHRRMKLCHGREYRRNVMLGQLRVQGKNIVDLSTDDEEADDETRTIVDLSTDEETDHEARTIVDLSTEEEADAEAKALRDSPGFQKQQVETQRPSHQFVTPEHCPGSTYNDAGERLLGRVLASAAAMFDPRGGEQMGEGSTNNSARSTYNDSGERMLGRVLARAAAMLDPRGAEEMGDGSNNNSNKSFLQELNLCNAQETSLLKKAAVPVSRMDEIGKQDQGRIHVSVPRNNQVTSALSGSSCGIELLEKEPRVELAACDHDEETDLDENDDYSPKSWRPVKRGNGKCIQKEIEKGSGDRPRKTPATASKGAAINNQDLLGIIAELLASANPSALAPNMLTQKAENSSGREVGSHQGTKSAKAKPAPKKKPAEGNLEKSKVEQASKKRKLSWLNRVPLETPKTEYELQRDEILRIRKNKLTRLGMVEALPPRQVRCKRWSSAPDPAHDRQTRLRERLSSGALQDVKQVLPVEEDLETMGVKPDPSFDYSAVAKFSNWDVLQDARLGAASCDLEGHLDKPSVMTGSRIVSFQAQQGQQQLYDPLLNPIYTMDVGHIRGQHNGLLAAGGIHGRITVFGLRTPGSSSTSECKLLPAALEQSELDGEPGVDLCAPKPTLLSWSVNGSRISQVMFLPGQFQENEMLLLSSSIDGRVVLWDINQVRMTEENQELSKVGMPRVVCESKSLHSGGIFGMHEWDGRMATASDDSVGFSILRGNMIFMERFAAGHHTRGIRNVRFRDKNILADCGMDMVIGLLDLRCHDPCTLKIQTAHKTGMNLVEWCPGSENVLLSASLDPQLYLHDIRSPGLFSQVLEGHVHSRRVKCYSAYRPAFVDGGDAIVTPGEGTHQLSIYSVATGSRIGTVQVGYDTTILHWNAQVPSARGSLWAARTYITQLDPIWRLRNDESDVHEQRQSPQYSNGGASVAAPPPPYLEEWQ